MPPGERRLPPRRRRPGGPVPPGEAGGAPREQTPDQRNGQRGQRDGQRGAHGRPTRTVEEISAGGLVVQRGPGTPQVALIARLNRAGRLEWCLPKGHLEGSETAEQAAVREVAEETGITGRVVVPLGTIDYWFSAEGRRIHKTVHHFLLEATGGLIGVEGDPDAEAVEAAWVPVDELVARLAFSNERRIARAATDILASSA